MTELSEKSPFFITRILCLNIFFISLSRSCMGSSFLFNFILTNMYFLKCHKFHEKGNNGVKQEGRVVTPRPQQNEGKGSISLVYLTRSPTPEGPGSGKQVSRTRNQVYRSRSRTGCHGSFHISAVNYTGLYLSLQSSNFTQ